MAVEVMGNAAHFRRRWPRRQHPQRIIDLHAVGIDDLAAPCLRQTKCERRLAARGRPRYQDRIEMIVEFFIMALVATLVAAPSNPVLTPALGEAAAASVAAAGLYWLADGIACDIALKDGSDAAAAEAALRAAVAAIPVDVIVQDADSRRKRLLIADMDSTMIQQECIDELAAEVGLKEKVAAITARAMNGEIAFEPALIERVALLKDLPASVVGEVIEKRITLMPGGPELVATMRARGHYTALVSGGFTVFTGPVAARLGFDENRANT